MCYERRKSLKSEYDFLLIFFLSKLGTLTTENHFRYTKEVAKDDAFGSIKKAG